MKSLSKITSHSSIPCLKKHFSRAYTNSCLHTALLSTTKNSISKDTGSRNLMQMNQRLLTTGLMKLTMQCTILLNTTKSVMLKSALSFQAAQIQAMLPQHLMATRHLRLDSIMKNITKSTMQKLYQIRLRLIITASLYQVKNTGPQFQKSSTTWTNRLQTLQQLLCIL